MGLKAPPARSTLADALNQRDWRIYHALAQRLIKRPQPAPALAWRPLRLHLTGHYWRAICNHSRSHQFWAAAGQERIDSNTLLANAPIVERAHEQPDLFEAAENEAIALDYAATGLTLRRHPLALLRSRLARRGWKSADQLAQLQDGAAAWACGIVTTRRPPPARRRSRRAAARLEALRDNDPPLVWKSLRGDYSVYDQALSGWYAYLVSANNWPPRA